MTYKEKVDVLLSYLNVSPIGWQRVLIDKMCEAKDEGKEFKIVVPRGSRKSLFGIAIEAYDEDEEEKE